MKIAIFALFIHVFYANNSLTKNKPCAQCYLPSGCVDEPLCHRAIFTMQTQLDFTQELWKDVVGYEGYYQVNNLGEVRGVERFVKHVSGGLKKVRSRVLYRHPDRKGYIRVLLAKEGKNKCCQVHRLVALAFIPNPNNKPCINHINLQTNDNNVVNLEWVTNRENTDHSVNMGSFIGLNRGEKQGGSKLKDKEVIQIKKYLNEGFLKSRETAQLFNASEQTICNIKKGRSWKH